MTKLLPISLLIAAFSLFGLAWIVTAVDPKQAPVYIFVAFVLLLFTFLFCILGILLYFARTRLYRRYSANWYFYTSYKMAFFVAAFAAVAATLAILGLVSLLNMVLAIIAISLFAIWSYLGKKGKP